MTALRKLADLNPTISACWEDKGGSFICRWFACWAQVDDCYVGAIGGYSGGGSYQLEKFYVTPSESILSLDESYSDLDEQIISFGEDAQDIVLEYNDEDTWFDTDSLHLTDSLSDSMKREDDLLLLEGEIPDRLLGLFDELGLTARPL